MLLAVEPLHDRIGNHFYHLDGITSPVFEFNRGLMRGTSIYVPSGLGKFRTVENTSGVFVERYYLDFREYVDNRFVHTHMKIIDPIRGVRVLINKHGIEEAIRIMEFVCGDEDINGNTKFELTESMFTYDALLQHEALKAIELCDALADIAYHDYDLHAHFQNYTGDDNNGYAHIGALINEVVDMYSTGIRQFGLERNLFNRPLSHFISLDTAGLPQIDQTTWATRHGVFTEPDIRRLTAHTLKRRNTFSRGNIDLDLIDGLLEGNAQTSLRAGDYPDVIRTATYSPVNELRVEYILHKYERKFTYKLNHTENKYGCCSKIINEFLNELGNALLEDVPTMNESVVSVVVEITDNAEAVLTISTQAYAKYVRGYFDLTACILVNDNMCHAYSITEVGVF